MNVANLETSQWFNYFKDSEKAPGSQKVGVELEFIGFHRQTMQRVNHQDIANVLNYFCQIHSWKPIYEKQMLVEAKKDGASLTIEPGCQLEYSSSPEVDLKSIEKSLQQFKADILEFSKQHDYMWLTIGLDPFNKLSDMPRVKKNRYFFMAEYLPKLGEESNMMMFSSCAWQLSLDYHSQQDMIKKMRASQLLSAIAVAISANSVVLEGKAGNFLDNRVPVCFGTDPARTGMLPFVFDEDFGYQKYIDYALNVPMLVLDRDGETINTCGENFVDFYRQTNGIDYETSDWETHLRSIFTAVRLKNVIEIRMMDSTSIEQGMALSAWWKALLYSEENLTYYSELAAEIGHEGIKKLVFTAAEFGLSGKYQDYSLAEMAKTSYDKAKAGIVEVDSSALDILSRLEQTIFFDKKNHASFIKEAVVNKQLIETLEQLGLIFA